MKTDFMSSFSIYSKESVSAAKEFLAINADLASKLLDKQLGFAGMMIEASEKQLEVATVSEPKELLAKQTAVLEETAAKFADVTQSTTSLFQEAGEEFKGWFEKGAKATEAAIKKAA